MKDLYLVLNQWYDDCLEHDGETFVGVFDSKESAIKTIRNIIVKIGEMESVDKVKSEEHLEEEPPCIDVDYNWSQERYVITKLELNHDYYFEEL